MTSNITIQLTDNKKCFICDDIANILCMKCENYYCDNCSKFIHAKSKNNQHQLEKVNEIINIETKCNKHENIPLNLFCIDEKILSCSMCYFEGEHRGHKILVINDIENLKKEKISIEDTKLEYETFIKKSGNLKINLEKEINDINNLSNKIKEEITNEYDLKIQNLKNEMKKLIDEIDLNVNEIIKKLNENLNKIQDQINKSTQINESLKYLNNLKDDQIIKKLTCISNINIHEKDLNKILSELMKSLKFTYSSENKNLKFDEYYFNGLPIPINIQIIYNSYSNINISWEIENLNIIHIKNKDEINYILEMKNENEESFKKIYEGNLKKYEIKNLISDLNYEFRIQCLFDNIKTKWSEIKKITIKKFDSIILSQSGREEEFLNKIFEWTGYKNMELLFRGTRDGMNSNSFHSKCDHKGQTICLYLNDKGYIFGGYASIPWTSDGSYHPAPESFIFTLTNIHCLSPTKFPVKKSDEGVYHHTDRGPTFGSSCDITIVKNFSEQNNTDFPCRYQDLSNKGRSIFTGDFDNNKTNFYIKEIEVFKVFN